MKKIIIIFVLFFLIGIYSNNNTKASVATGHENIASVKFNGDGKLLVDITEEELNETIKNLGRKVFGWEIAYFNYQRKIEYEGETIFSKINRSSEPISFKYEMNDEEVKTTSISTNGSLSTKISGTIEKIKTAITVAISGEVEYKDVKESTNVKTTKIDINIMPGRKLSLLTKGDAYVTTAYSKYYFFGITLRKGTWETITIDTIYYELVEEVLEWKEN